MAYFTAMGQVSSRVPCILLCCSLHPDWQTSASLFIIWRPLRYVSRLILLKQVPLRYVSYSQTQDRIVLFSVVDGGKITFIVLSI